ncbi:TfpX/TfpZ family type IV pilin accessory protein [Ottowia caeni]|uniref:TfpX/TfpZ family type IV pilin accessory protein n=1 Tax=Ottowia caeni TaxID=2870339 RepID=UPI001E421186|nr:hypothetical protein [Ottowia caeni]
MWLAKLKAFSIHFIATALLAALAAYLVFNLWFPHPFAEMMGGIKLFVLVVACDLALGPLMSLVIYNPNKRRNELLTDYAVVITLQIAALAYGLHTVGQARIAFLVFTVDRYVVVSAGELPKSERKKALQPEWRGVDWVGYHTVFVQQVADPSANYQLIMSALGGGRDLQHVVENYRPVAEHLADILQVAKSMESLRSRFPEQVQAIDAAVVKSAREEQGLLWLPVQAARVFWVAIIDARTALPVAWLNIDSL